jgi:Uma2 family endonuclease
VPCQREEKTMTIPKQQHLYTVNQYLAFERGSEERHYYMDGEIYLMAGESDAHAYISVNLVGILYGQLRGKPCRLRTKDTKVRSGPTLKAGETTHVLFSYPDIVVVCEKPEFLDAHKDVVLNPTAIMEVLSQSTEAFDRGEKFTRYKSWNPTLGDYVLVSQDKPQVEHYTREKDESWSCRVYKGLDCKFTIESIGCSLSLAEVFEGVDFSESVE